MESIIPCVVAYLEAFILNIFFWKALVRRRIGNMALPTARPGPTWANVSLDVPRKLIPNLNRTFFHLKMPVPQDPYNLRTL